MAPKAAILLLGLLVAVFCMQIAWANGDDAIGTSNAAIPDLSSSGVQVSEATDLMESDADEFEDFDDTTDSQAESEVDNQGLKLKHPLARLLQSRLSKNCWSANKCTVFYKKPGCCKHTCVNLATDKSNCGTCGKGCKKGTSCTNGKCVEETPKCGGHQACKKGEACCNGKCLKLRSDKSNCGKCGKTCSSGSSCCDGQCKNVMGSDSRNCGGCGKLCKYGDVCCRGKCTFIHGSDRQNCGGCGKYCHTKCVKGTCGYGHYADVY